MGSTDRAKLSWTGPRTWTAVQRTLDEGGHDGTEGADVEVVLAHIVPQLGIDVGVGLFGGFQVGVDAQSFDGLGVAAVEGNAVLDVDAIAFFVLFQGLDIVADLRLRQTSVTRP